MNACFKCHGGWCVPWDRVASKPIAGGNLNGILRMRPPARHPLTLGINQLTKHRPGIRNLSPNGLVASTSTGRQTDEQGWLPQH